MASVRTTRALYHKWPGETIIAQERIAPNIILCWLDHGVPTAIVHSVRTRTVTRISRSMFWHASSGSIRVGFQIPRRRLAQWLYSSGSVLRVSMTTRNGVFGKWRPFKNLMIPRFTRTVRRVKKRCTRQRYSLPRFALRRP